MLKYYGTPPAAFYSGTTGSGYEWVNVILRHYSQADLDKYNMERVAFYTEVTRTQNTIGYTDEDMPRSNDTTVWYKSFSNAVSKKDYEARYIFFKKVKESGVVAKHHFHADQYQRVVERIFVSLGLRVVDKEKFLNEMKYSRSILAGGGITRASLGLGDILTDHKFGRKRETKRRVDPDWVYEADHDDSDIVINWEGNMQFKRYDSKSGQHVLEEFALIDMMFILHKLLKLAPYFSFFKKEGRFIDRFIEVMSAQAALDKMIKEAEAAKQGDEKLNAFKQALGYDTVDRPGTPMETLSSDDDEDQDG